MTNDLFTSRPLAEAQAEAAQRAAQPGTPQRPLRPLPIVDMNLDDLPETTYADFVFQLGGITYYLGIEDDRVLFDISEANMAEGSPTQLFDFFFEETYRKALDEDGNELADGLDRLMEAIALEPADGRKPVPRRNLLKVMTTAVEGWMAELTDTNVRPNRRARRR